MKVDVAIRSARRRRGLSQRHLAQLASIPQSTLARIESGKVSPRWSTVEQLLEICGEELEAHARLGVGIDRSLIRHLLALTPQQRLDTAAASASKLRELLDRR